MSKNDISILKRYEGKFLLYPELKPECEIMDHKYQVAINDPETMKALSHVYRSDKRPPEHYAYNLLEGWLVENWFQIQGVKYPYISKIDLVGPDQDRNILAEVTRMAGGNYKPGADIRVFFNNPDFNPPYRDYNVKSALSNYHTVHIKEDDYLQCNTLIFMLNSMTVTTVNASGYPDLWKFVENMNWYYYKDGVKVGKRCYACPVNTILTEMKPRSFKTGKPVIYKLKP